MKHSGEVHIYACIAIIVPMLCIHAVCRAGQGQPRKYNENIEGYVRFLRTQDMSSADYVLSLFQEYDLVILCERAHPEMTQYDLILRVLNDSRFIEQVGHVFTESGTSSMAPSIESFLTDVTLSEEGVEERARQICRNLTWLPYREMTNYYELLKSVHQSNKELPEDKRIHVYPSDMPFDWSGMTPAKYQEFRDELRQRDKIMADQIAARFDAIRNSTEPRKKALVIMNYRHAFGHLEVTLGGRTKRFQNCGGFLMARYPGSVANVMVNSIKPLLGSTDNKLVMTAMQDGKWDAAFSVVGNPDRGFDFVDSPFGDDNFDYFPVPNQYKYRDVFTGFVYYKPPHEHLMSEGIPDSIDASFARELARRYRIEGELKSAREIAEKIREHRTIRTFGYENEALFGASDYRDKIRKWLGQAN